MAYPNDHRWYDDGLRFCCTRCSLCCRFESGYVWLSRADLERLARGTALGTEEVIARYCRPVDVGGFGQLSLREQPNRDCVFWDNGGCTVYRFRPAQCSSYPFWAPNLSNAEQWTSTADTCPGIGVGRRFSADQIDAILAERRFEQLISAPFEGADSGR